MFEKTLFADVPRQNLLCVFAINHFLSPPDGSAAATLFFAAVRIVLKKKTNLCVGT
ncbi:hypothetical protein J4460_06495 [Candidatus Woesearchaeota archaeon]|nr:hypothetical protein [Candidatus Woesearchaeota archaeon]HIH37336.1 hypothetical protein [Candidatus Woesearchaeota archaeon]HIJ04149.1 hypothetical protein [Candidatus Woesearchaeota archaeon]